MNEKKPANKPLNLVVFVLSIAVVFVVMSWFSSQLCNEENPGDASCKQVTTGLSAVVTLGLAAYTYRSLHRDGKV